MKDILSNKIIIGGQVVEDYETTGKNANVAEFTISCTQEVKRGNAWVEEATLWPCKLYLKDQDFLGQIVKGAKAIVSGTLKPYWKDDQTFSGYSIWVDAISFMEVLQSAPMAPEAMPKPVEPVGPEGFEESEIPF